MRDGGPGIPQSVHTGRWVTPMPWPMVQPLEVAELEHYRWLAGGIARGLIARAAVRGDEVAIRAQETLLDLFDELLARLETPPMPDPLQAEIDGLAAIPLECVKAIDGG